MILLKEKYLLPNLVGKIFLEHYSISWKMLIAFDKFIYLWVISLYIFYISYDFELLNQFMQIPHKWA